MKVTPTNVNVKLSERENMYICSFDVDLGNNFKKQTFTVEDYLYNNISDHKIAPLTDFITSFNNVAVEKAEVDLNEVRKTIESLLNANISKRNKGKWEKHPFRLFIEKLEKEYKTRLVFPNPDDVKNIKLEVKTRNFDSFLAGTEEIPTFIGINVEVEADISGKTYKEDSYIEYRENNPRPFSFNDNRWKRHTFGNTEKALDAFLEVVSQKLLSLYRKDESARASDNKNKYLQSEFPNANVTSKNLVRIGVVDEKYYAKGIELELLYAKETNGQDFFNVKITGYLTKEQALEIAKIVNSDPTKTTYTYNWIEK